MTVELGQCASYNRQYPKSQMVLVTDDMAQGYERTGYLVCPSCASDIEYHSLTVEDSDLEDEED